MKTGTIYTNEYQFSILEDGNGKVTARVYRKIYELECKWFSEGIDWQGVWEGYDRPCQDPMGRIDEDFLHRADAVERIKKEFPTAIERKKVI